VDSQIARHGFFWDTNRCMGGDVDARGSFDIFRKLPNDSPAWVETRASLESAVDRARELAASGPGDFFIFDRQGRRFVDASSPQISNGPSQILAAS
jgi:hypothetical protein